MTGRLFLAVMLLVSAPAAADAEQVTFHLVTHSANQTLLPQPKGIPDESGDHLLRTADDIQHDTYNPDGCFSFNFMNPVGVDPSQGYPAGYTEGIHCMTGSVVLDIDLAAGGQVSFCSLSFDGWIAAGKPLTRQRLVEPGDPAADGAHGVDGLDNDGTYSAAPGSNWALTGDFDWYYDTPAGGPGTIDITFDDYAWEGFIIPVSQLAPAGLAGTTLDDPLGYFPGTSGDFESWLLDEVAPRLSADAAYLLFAQGEESPSWFSSQCGGMTADGIIAETIVAYAVPEPAMLGFLAAGLVGLAGRRRRRAPAV